VPYNPVNPANPVNLVQKPAPAEFLHRPTCLFALNNPILPSLFSFRRALRRENPGAAQKIVPFRLAVIALFCREQSYLRQTRFHLAALVEMTKNAGIEPASRLTLHKKYY